MWRGGVDAKKRCLIKRLPHRRSQVGRRDRSLIHGSEMLRGVVPMVDGVTGFYDRVPTAVISALR